MLLTCRCMGRNVQIGWAVYSAARLTRFCHFRRPEGNTNEPQGTPCETRNDPQTFSTESLSNSKRLRFRTTSSDMTPWCCKVFSVLSSWLKSRGQLTRVCTYPQTDWRKTNRTPAYHDRAQTWTMQDLFNSFHIKEEAAQDSDTVIQAWRWCNRKCQGGWSRNFSNTLEKTGVNSWFKLWKLGEGSESTTLILRKRSLIPGFWTSRCRVANWWLWATFTKSLNGKKNESVAEAPIADRWWTWGSKNSTWASDKATSLPVGKNSLKIEMK